MRRVAWPCLGALVLWAISCGEATPSFRTEDTTGASTQADGGNEPPQLPVDENAVGLDIGDAGIDLLGGDNACLSEVREAERLDVDLFISLDRSGSMLDWVGNTQVTKWDAVNEALIGFFESPDTADLGLGLRVFPQLFEDVPEECYDDQECGEGGPCSILGLCSDGNYCTSDVGCDDPSDDCQTGYCSGYDVLACANDDDCTVGNTDVGPCEPLSGYCVQGDSCDPDTYAEPDVPITLGAERNTALIEALENTEPTGFTPTRPALEGAIDYAFGWSGTHPGRMAAVVLVTDGFPTECTDVAFDPVEPVLQVARLGVEMSPPIRTYVIGVFSAFEGQAGAADILDAMAEAGDTDEAFFIDTDGDVTADFLAALEEISSTAISCEFLLPEDDELDFNTVNLRLTQGDGDEVQLANVGSPSGCNADGDIGWYYVDDADGVPFQIRVCPEVCSQFARSGGGRVDLQIGCATILR